MSNGSRWMRLLMVDMCPVFKGDEVTLKSCPHAPNISTLSASQQHLRGRLDKLVAKGIGLLDVALTEAFELLSSVSTHVTTAYSSSFQRFILHDEALIMM